MPMTFREHLDHASAIVKTWPKWKREILGDKDSDMPMTKDEAVKWIATAFELTKKNPSAGAMVIGDIAEMLASAIIPTPELREAVEFVCKAADAYFGVGVTFRSQPIAIATVRAAFKENEDGG